MKEIENGTEFFDGSPVELYDGRFSGSFEIDFDDGLGMGCGDLVCFVVTARVDAPKFSRNKVGELKRTNVLKIEDAVTLSPSKAKFLLDEIGRKVNGVNDGLVEVSQSSTVDQISINSSLVPLYESFVGS